MYKGMNIFQKVDKFSNKVGLFWTDCVVVYTDKAAAIIGHTAGWVSCKKCTYYFYTLYDSWRVPSS